ncbi:MAG: polysaccharide biosynthesis protein [Brevundimonas sp.]|nr:MAG: polysaccharide biosynthesis protein [Brevundimonas sp.]
MAIKQNVIANYAGYGVRTIAGIAFIPLYVRLLGADAFGLIAVFAMLQVWLSMIDVGMKPALSREMARYTAGVIDVGSIRDLLRSVECITLVVGVIAALIVWAASGWLATNWIRSTAIAEPVVARALAIMGVVAAFRFGETLYASCLTGLQHQVLENALSSAAVILRNVGAVIILMTVSPTVEAYFIWQGVASLISIIAMAVAVYRMVPASDRRARVSLAAVSSVWRFALGSMAITILSLVMTQTDKVVLSRVLTLDAFGYYALAGVAANVLAAAATPISAAFYPRLNQLVAVEDGLALRRVYHQAAQCVTVLAGAAGLVLIAFAYPIILLWTSDPALTARVAPITAILTLGMVLHCLAWMPYYLQLAHGWVSLSIWSNVAALALYVPAILVVAPAYGAVGTAWLWVALNGASLLVGVVIMHRRLIPDEIGRWLVVDVAAPLAAIAAVVVLGRSLMPIGLNGLVLAAWVGAVGIAALAAAVFAAPLVRDQAFAVLERTGRKILNRVE